MFKPGDKALFMFVPSVVKTDVVDTVDKARVHDNQIVLILEGPLEYIPAGFLTVRFVSGAGYRIRFDDGSELFVDQMCLHPLPPPKTEPLAKWEDVPYFNPTKVTA